MKTNVLAVLAASILCANGIAQAQSPALGTVAGWQWLADTFWYVPASNLPALLLDAETEVLVPISDQTVFHVTGYRDGYFWGRTVARLQRGPVSRDLSLIARVGHTGRPGALDLHAYRSDGSADRHARHWSDAAQARSVDDRTSDVHRSQCALSRDPLGLHDAKRPESAKLAIRARRRRVDPGVFGAMSGRAASARRLTCHRAVALRLLVRGADL